MKKSLFSLYVLCACIFSAHAIGCNPLSAPAEQFLWKQSLSDSKLIEGELPTILHNGTIVALGVKGGKKTLYAFDASTGEPRWRWSDWFLSDRYILVDYVHTYDNVLVISNRGTNYGINTQTGMTVWSNDSQNRQSGTQGASGIGQWYFFGADISLEENYLMRGNIYRNDERILLTMPRATGAFHSAPFVAQNGDTMIVYFSVYGEPATNFRNRTYLGLYNLSKQQEVYRLLQDTSSPENANVFPGGIPLIRNNRIYSGIGRSVQCSDLETGKLLWRTKTEWDFNVSGIIEGDGTIFGNNPDGYLHAFDNQTGKLLWKVKASGTSRRPFYMNGVVYIVGVGDGKLYAFDAKTGNKIWAFDSPDDDGRSGSSFKGIISGANGRIYVQSYLNLYCYKAAR
jgi:outer membrane protein assembly factor BamB